MNPYNPAQKQSLRLIKDQANQQVQVPETISRIAVVQVYPLPAVLASVFDLAQHIVSMPHASMTAAKNGLCSELYPRILEAKTVDAVAGADKVDTEALKRLNPDIVFYLAEDEKMRAQLQGAGLTAVGISGLSWDFDPVATLNHWLEFLATLFGTSPRGDLVQKHTAKSLAQIEATLDRLQVAQRQKVCFLYQATAQEIQTSGRHFYGQHWADAIHATNVAAALDDPFGSPVKRDQIQAWQPDVLYISNFTTLMPKDLYANPAWQTIAAVKNQRVYKMPLGMYRSFTPGVDTPITLLWLAQQTYPQQFAAQDIAAKTKAYYADVFHIQLTTAQVHRIFNPAVAASVL